MILDLTFRSFPGHNTVGLMWVYCKLDIVAYTVISNSNITIIKEQFHCDCFLFRAYLTIYLKKAHEAQQGKWPHHEKMMCSQTMASPDFYTPCNTTNYQVWPTSF